MKKYFFFSLLVSLFAAACGNSKQATSTNDIGQPLYGRQWNLVELNGGAIASSRAQLTFIPGKINRVSGNAGCNKLNGTFKLSGTDGMLFLPLGTTKMACPGNPDVETPFLAALQQVSSWSITDNTLLLKRGDAVLAKLTGVAQESSALKGTWELNYISGRRIAFEGLYPGKKPFIRFESILSAVTGNTSCNSFTGTAAVDGNTIRFADDMIMTRMACPGEGEAAFLEMIKKVNKYSVTAGSTLTLLMDDVAVMRFTKKS